MSYEKTDHLRSFTTAVEELDAAYVGREEIRQDECAERQLRAWLGDLPWAGDGVTADEWFFITTLYGEMTVDGQRSHIIRFFKPLLVVAADRDIRNLVAGMSAYAGLRSNWMSRRLARMGEILRERRQTMEEYASCLRDLERGATPTNPLPALDAIVRDHRATGWKTLSCFIRDCVQGNSFPVDSRVQKQLDRWSLPGDERLLVSLSLALGRNPREIARMFYDAGGE